MDEVEQIRGSSECQYSDFYFYTLKNNNNNNIIYMTELIGDFDYINYSFKIHNNQGQSHLVLFLSFKKKQIN